MHTAEVNDVKVKDESNNVYNSIKSNFHYENEPMAEMSSISEPNEVEQCNGHSIIPMEILKGNDDHVIKAVNEKLNAKDVKIKGINLHRDTVDKLFVRLDVLIEPVDIQQLRETDFECCSCFTLPYQIFQKENG